ncbi:hypothetical protein [Kitasatospora purpeofusca]
MENDASVLAEPVTAPGEDRIPTPAELEFRREPLEETLSLVHLHRG